MKTIKKLILLYIFALILSGVTAFPLKIELELLIRYCPEDWSVYTWITKVYEGLSDTYQKYPFMAYGTDWLAFAHIAIAIFFIGVIKDPIRNIWVIDAAIIISILIFPLAFIAGGIRGIPFYWQLIDCSFGLFSIIILWPIKKMILKLNHHLQMAIQSNTKV